MEEFKNCQCDNQVVGLDLSSKFAHWHVRKVGPRSYVTCSLPFKGHRTQPDPFFAPEKQEILERKSSSFLLFGFHQLLMFSSCSLLLKTHASGRNLSIQRLSLAERGFVTRVGEFYLVFEYVYVEV